MSPVFAIYFGFVVGILFCTGMLFVTVDQCRHDSPTGECSIRMEWSGVKLEQVEREKWRKPLEILAKRTDPV